MPLNQLLLPQTRRAAASYEHGNYGCMEQRTFVQFLSNSVKFCPSFILQLECYSQIQLAVATSLYSLLLKKIKMRFILFIIGGGMLTFFNIYVCIKCRTIPAVPIWRMHTLARDSFVWTPRSTRTYPSMRGSYP